MKNQNLLICLFVFVILSFGCTPKQNNALRVSKVNPRYFTDNSGKAIYLTGSHTWNNLVEMTETEGENAFNYEAYLKFLQSYNHNFFRLWKWDMVNWNTAGNKENNSRNLKIYPQPWLRTGPEKALDGKLKFDLTKFNPEYFERLKARVEAAGKRNIYVSVMLFEGWGLQFSPESFQNHPFHPSNNINKTLPKSFPDSLRLEIYELKHENITRLQEVYVREVIKTVSGFDNVLYEISNENHPASKDWQYHMIRYVKQVEQEMGKSHPVGMTFQYKGGKNTLLFDSPADWISPNPEGGYRDNPPVNTGVKIILADTDHLGGIWGTRQWVWKSFLRGINPIFMDPYDGKILEKGAGSVWVEEVRVAMGHTLQFAEKMDLINMTPSSALSSSGFCLAKEGKEYLVYISEGKDVKINLTSVSGEYTVEWFNPADGTISKGKMVSGNHEISLVSPFGTNEAVVYLKVK